MNDRFARLAFICFMFALVGTVEGFEGKTFLSRTSNDVETNDEFVAPSDGSIYLGPTLAYAEWLKLDPEKTWLNVEILGSESEKDEKNDVEKSDSDTESSDAENSSKDETKKAERASDAHDSSKTSDDSAAETKSAESKKSKTKDVKKSKTAGKTTENVELSDDASTEDSKKEEKVEREKSEASEENDPEVEEEDSEVEVEEEDSDEDATNSKEENEVDDSVDLDEIDDATICSIKRPKLVRRGERVEGSFVLQTCQRAVLVWNGRVNDQGEELLIVESDEYAKVEGNDVVLGILPLPGKPLEITRVGDEFRALRDVTINKIQEITKPGKITPQDVDANLNKVPSYCVLVVECDDVALFEDVVESKLSEIFGDARLSLKDSEKRTLKNYSERGIRYFAIDVAEIAGDEDVQKAPLAFRFKSDKLYYPMQIAQIGSQDFLALEAIVLTPKKIVWTQGSWLEPEKQKEAEVFVNTMGKKTVDFTVDELKEKAPTVAKFCEEAKIDKITARDLIVRGYAGRFEDDLIMTNGK